MAMPPSAPLEVDLPNGVQFSRAYDWRCIWNSRLAVSPLRIL